MSQEEINDSSSVPPPPEPAVGPMSGFEVANSALDTAGKVATATGHGLVRIYGLILLILGLVGLFVIPEFAAKVGCLAIAGYGLYLLLGGSWVVY